MSMSKDISLALKEKRLLFGINSARKALQGKQVEMIVIANNCPAELVSELTSLTKLSNAKLQIFEGTNLELGTLCKKPFPLAVLVVKSK
jgi:large subunit ribosomal protein L30e